MYEKLKLELFELAGIYEAKGLRKETALQVAKEFTEKYAFAAHVRDEPGIKLPGGRRSTRYAIAE